jgi:hypothetical protein
LKNNKTYIYIFIITIIIFIVGELLSPKEIDWKLSYSKNDKIPYGCYILQEQLEQLLDKDSLITNNLSLYEFFNINRPIKTNFIFINSTFSVSDLELDKILKYAKIGNDVFIGAGAFSQNICDSLKFEVNYSFSMRDSLYLYFTNPLLNNKYYLYKKAFENNCFISFDTLNSSILGINDSEELNFLKIKYGNGNFYINLESLAFTNYNILIDNNYEYTFKSLSYLEKRKTYWDEYYKPGNSVNSSPLNVILKSKSFKAGYFIALAGLILYLLFMGKRNQRIIPIITPLANTSLEFTEIIARLYLHRRNHKDIALKKYKYFLEFLRNKFNIKINDNSEIDVFYISLKTNVDKETLEQLFELENYIYKAHSINEDLLYKFNLIIEDFYRKCLN